jgi:hypothetical protein
MIKKLRWSLVIVLITFLFSCGSSGNKTELDIKNDLVNKQLAIKYNADTTWNLTAHYSFDLQEMFVKSKKMMLFKGKIYDIIIEDSIYVIKVLDEREDSEQNYIAFITFNSEKVAKFFKENQSQRGAFIIKVSKVNCSLPSIKTDEVSNGDDNYTVTYLSDQADNMVQIFNGTVIDFHLNEMEKK